MANADSAVVAGFGDEWSRFDQTGLSPAEKQALFDRYFAIFPWRSLPPAAVGADIGCGSGRWASLAAGRVGRLICVDPSPQALGVAARNLSNLGNCEFVCAPADEMPLTDASLDFAYSLGVLHHAPDTAGALAACVRKLKPGAPFLVYLYYSLDNRPAWFRGQWRLSDLLRRCVSHAPHPVRYALSQVLATVVYWPLARLALAGEAMGANVRHWPLAPYRRQSFYVMRTDSLDRFGTRLEHRFSRRQVEAMMIAAGLKDIRFSEETPYWTAVGLKA